MGRGGRSEGVQGREGVRGSKHQGGGKKQVKGASSTFPFSQNHQEDHVQHYHHHGTGGPYKGPAPWWGLEPMEHPNHPDSCAAGWRCMEAPPAGNLPGMVLQLSQARARRQG